MYSSAISDLLMARCVRLICSVATSVDQHTVCVVDVAFEGCCCFVEQLRTCYSQDNAIVSVNSSGNGVRYIVGQIDRQTDRQKDEQTDGWMDRQTPDVA